MKKWLTSVAQLGLSSWFGWSVVILILDGFWLLANSPSAEVIFHPGFHLQYFFLLIPEFSVKKSHWFCRLNCDSLGGSLSHVASTITSSVVGVACFPKCTLSPCLLLQAIHIQLGMFLTTILNSESTKNWRKMNNFWVFSNFSFSGVIGNNSRK